MDQEQKPQEEPSEPNNQEVVERLSKKLDEKVSSRGTVGSAL